VDRNASQRNEARVFGISETFQPVLDFFRLAEWLGLSTMHPHKTSVFLAESMLAEQRIRDGAGG
jgi:hypothetical protein